MDADDLEAALATAHAALLKKAEQETEDPAFRLIEHIMLRSLDGDPSLIPFAAAIVLRTLLLTSDGDLSASERLWLVEILNRARGESAARVLAGKTGRGAPRKGRKGLDVAWDVLRQVLDKRQPSMEAAWATVAEERSMDHGTVRKYWVDWKPFFLEGTTLEKDFKQIVRGNREQRNPVKK